MKNHIVGGGRGLKVRKRRRRRRRRRRKDAAVDRPFIFSEKGKWRRGVLLNPKSVVDKKNPFSWDIFGKKIKNENWWCYFLVVDGVLMVVA